MITLPRPRKAGKTTELLEMEHQMNQQAIEAAVKKMLDLEDNYPHDFISDGEEVFCECGFQCSDGTGEIQAHSEQEWFTDILEAARPHIEAELRQKIAADILSGVFPDGEIISGCPICGDMWESQPSCEHYPVFEVAAQIAEGKQ